jgi:O-methyltransferase involved in polyketide biosynthesis
MAFMVVGFRALETERREPLFRDPLAAKLAGEHGRSILVKLPRVYFGEWSVVIRRVIIDNLIKRAIAEGVVATLNLGAGLDTRPYRITLPKSLRCVEADYPHVPEAIRYGQKMRARFMRNTPFRFYAKRLVRLFRPAWLASAGDALALGRSGAA